MSANYTKTTWVNGAAPAIDADHLNHLEAGVEAVDAAAVAAVAAEIVRAQTAEGANAANIAANATAIAARYIKPGSGIPASDLAAAVQAQLALAQSALQTAPVTTVAGKTGAVSLVKGDVGLGNVDNTSDASKPLSTAATTALAAKADLVGGVIPTGQIPALALVTSVPVASQAAMLALTTSQVQPGDLAVRTDGAGTFILTATDPSVLGNWRLLNAPTDVVSSVNGQQGTVVLGKSDVGLANVDNTADVNKPVSTAQAAADAAARSGAVSDAAAAAANIFLPLLTPTAIKTAAYTAAKGELVRVDISGGSFPVTLPPASSKWDVVVKVVTASSTFGSTSAAVTAAGSDTINAGATSIPLRYANQSKRFTSDGAGVITVSGGDFDLTVGDQRNDLRYLTAPAITNPTINGDPISEYVQDQAAQMLIDGNAANVGIAGTYDDANNRFSYTVTAVGNPLGLIGRPQHIQFASQSPAPVLTYAGSGQVDGSGLYYPMVVKVTGKIASPINGAAYYLLCSTNHSPTTGGLYLATANSPTGPWTWVVGSAGNSAVYVDNVGSTSQCEGPWIVWEPVSQLWFVYYQVQGVNGNQGTVLAVTPDFVTWERIGVSFISQPNLYPGDQHYGYARITRLGRNQWVALHLNGGTNYSRASMSYSEDGVTWLDDPTPVNPDRDNSGALGLNVSPRGNYFYLSNQLWSIGAKQVPSSGTATGDIDIVAGPMAPSLTRFTRPPQTCWAPGYAWETNVDNNISTFLDDDGSMYLYYVAGTIGSGGIGVAKAALVPMREAL